MPFLQMLWDPERVRDDRILRLRDILLAHTGPALMAADPRHIVNETMVDVRVVAIGPHDRLRADVFVTLFARHEPARSAAAHEVIERLQQAVTDATGGSTIAIELVLTDHYSSVDYGAME